MYDATESRAHIAAILLAPEAQRVGLNNITDDDMIAAVDRAEVLRLISAGNYPVEVEEG